MLPSRTPDANQDVPVAVVADAVEAGARARGDAVRRESSERAREVLAQAEQEVRALLAEGLSETEFAARSSEIVARADREVRQILAQGRNDAEVVEMRVGHQAAELRQHANEQVTVVEGLPESDASQSTEAPFATLRATAVPTDAEGELRYRVVGALTLATMLAFEQTVGRLPGVSSARVTPEPEDVALLSLTASDPRLVSSLLARLPGVRLQVEAA